MPWMARSGAAGVASATLFLPISPATAAPASSTTATTSAASQASTTVARPRIAVVTNVATREEREQPGDAEHPDADTRALALLGDLGLGEADLGADELGDLLGELVDQGAEGLTLWRSVLSSHVIDPAKPVRQTPARANP